MRKAGEDMIWLGRRILKRLLVALLLTGAIIWLLSGPLMQFGKTAGVSTLVEKIQDLQDLLPARSVTKPRRATVSRVIDGDTLEVTFRSGRTRPVRLIGFDTPESKRPGTPVECGALQATSFMRRIAEQKPVKLTGDPGQDNVDRYGRLLAYGQVGNRDLGQRMIRAGWGAPYVFNPASPPVKTGSYRRAAAAARSAGRGVWSLCAGDFHSAGDQPWSGD